MLGWERLEDETSQQYRAFCLYRDMGPGRSLRAVAEALYGERWKHGKRTVEKWSSRHDWVDRVRALEARDEMLKREAVREYLQSEAADLAEREAAIQRGLLEVREQALAQAKHMLKWPLTEQRIIRDEDGEETTVIAMPAGWSKNTAVSLAQLAAGVGTPTFSPEIIDPEQLDLSNVSTEELQAYLRLDRKINGGL